MANVFIPDKDKYTDSDCDREGLENFIMNKENELKSSSSSSSKTIKKENTEKKEKPEKKETTKKKTSTASKEDLSVKPKPKRMAKENKSLPESNSDNETENKKNISEKSNSNNAIAEDIQTLYKIIYHIVSNNDYDTGKSYDDYVAIKNKAKTIKITYYYDLSDFILGLYKNNDESFETFCNISLTSDNDFDNAIESLINKTFNNSKSKLFAGDNIKEIYNCKNGMAILALCKLLRCIIVYNKINDVQKYTKINKKKILELCNNMICSCGMFEQKKINYVD